MTFSTPCPSHDALLRAAAAAALPAEIDAHLKTCSACHEAFVELRGTEAFLDAFAASLADSEYDLSNARDATAPRAPTLAGYRIGEEMRHGGQGIVYRAVHEASGRDVALKVVRAGSHRRRARIEREATLAARLRHPNIVTIHDCGPLADGRYAIALELIHGQPLDEWAKALRAPDARTERLRAFVRICDAIEHAHRHGVIHCDLKPDNILVDDEGEPHVLDFGVARATTTTDGQRITVTGEIACTIAYASPEQLASDRTAVDTRTDVYSLGVILYELLTSRLPHPADRGISALVSSISSAPPLPPSAVNRQTGEAPIDRDLDTIVLTALSKDPERRYQTAAALKADVLHYLASEPIAARRDSLGYVIRKALVRHRQRVVVAALAGCIALAGITAMIIASARARDAAQREESERVRMRAQSQRSDAVAEMLRELVPLSNTDSAQEAIRWMSMSLESGTFSDDPEAAATARLAIGDICVDQGSVRRAEVEYRQANRLLRTRAQPIDPLLGNSEERLALLLLLRSSLDEALMRAEAAASIRRQTLGPDHPDTLHSLCTIGRVHIARQERERAEYYRTILDQHPTIVHETNPPLMDAVYELRAALAAAEGDHDLARTWCEARARAALIAHGDSHPAVRAAFDALANALPAEHERAKTLRSISRILQARSVVDADPSDIARLVNEKKQLLGARHPDLVETLMQLANRLAALERWQETADVCLEAEEIAMPDGIAETVGEADLWELRADALWFLGRANDATELGRRQLAALRPLLKGHDDVHLTVRIKELSFRCLDSGDLATARALSEEAVALARSLSPNDPHLGWTLVEVADNFRRMEDLDRANTLALDGMAILTRAGRSYAWHRAIGNYRLAYIQAMRGERTAAIDSLRRARVELVSPEVPLRDRPSGLRLIEMLMADLEASGPMSRTPTELGQSTSGRAAEVTSRSQ